MKGADQSFPQMVPSLRLGLGNDGIEGFLTV